MATVREILGQAAEIQSPEERAAFLNAACADNSAIRAEVESLLSALAQAGSFMDAAAPGPATATYVLGAREMAADGTDTPAPGSAIGAYHILKPLGEGGFGAVFLAEQQQPVRRLVALKIIKAGMDSAQVIQRFEAERQALALMEHTHIARIFDAGETTSGRPYFVMELVRGEPITKYCDSVDLPIHERLEMFIHVCAAVHHAHQKGILHRDIKPSNVLVCMQDGKPIPKVIDFGVAKALDEAQAQRTQQTQVGQIIGTLEYMSPEQADLSAMDIDTRADVYALGVLLYELLTGSTPLDRKSLSHTAYGEILRRIREEEPERPSTRLRKSQQTLADIAAQRRTAPGRLTQKIRGDLDWIVMKCLEKDRTRRYESASALGRDIERFLRHEPVEARPPSLTYRLSKLARRRRTTLVLSACLAAIALVVLVSGLLLREASRETEVKRRHALHAQQVKDAHEKLSVVQQAIRQERYDEALAMLQSIEELIPDHAQLPDLWDQCSQKCQLSSAPSGAQIWRRSFDAKEDSWLFVGQTEDRLATVRIPRGEHVWRASKAGYADVIGLRLPPHVSFILDEETALPKEMVRIPMGQPRRPVLAFAVALPPVELLTYLIDRQEVSNRDYEKFVKAGGYERSELWRDLPFVDAAGKPADGDRIRALFVDQTGHPGPATWRHGRFLPGEEDHPVTGISWYEAMAYARSVGKSLPTVSHWQLAVEPELSVVLGGSALIDRCNFGRHVRPVTELADLTVHGLTGALGNVKEWCFNADTLGQRFILGGACGEPIYAPFTMDRASPLKRDPFCGFRCMRLDPANSDPPAAWNPIGGVPWPAPVKREQLLDDDAFRLVVRDRFLYDRNAPLDVLSETVDEGDWLHVMAQINTSYRDAKGHWERMRVHLYLPKNVDPKDGYQAIIYSPARDAWMLPRARPLPAEYGLDAIVRAGRAVLLPVYKGTYERRQIPPPADFKSAEETRLQFGLDLMRALDYLEQRGDIRMSQLGFYGFSHGASWAASFVAIDPRIRAAVFEAGGLPISPARKDRLFLDWRHYLPQIRVPVLMINGQADPVFPVKESQTPQFQLLGSSTKEHFVHPLGHHMLPPDVKFGKAIPWFDQHLGAPAVRASLLERRE